MTRYSVLFTITEHLMEALANKMVLEKGNKGCMRIRKEVITAPNL